MSARLTLLALACAVLLAGMLGLYWKGRGDGARRARPAIEAALAQAEAARLEAAGAQASAARVEVVVRQREAVARDLAQFTQDALTSETADAPLDPDRTDRLRAFDERLCRQAPGLAGCAAPGDAGPG